MLRVEARKVKFIVYPSWAEGQIVYSWKELPGVFADPLNSPYLDSNTRFYLKDNPNPIQDTTYFDGPWGGGIIAVEARENERWLPDAVIRNLADCCAPPMLNRIIPEYPIPVCYLEPVSDLRRGYKLLGWGKAPKLYVPTVMFEYSVNFEEHFLRIEGIRLYGCLI